MWLREIEERRVDKKVVGINMLVLIHFHQSSSLSTYKLDLPISLRERESIPCLKFYFLNLIVYKASCHFQILNNLALNTYFEL